MDTEERIRGRAEEQRRRHARERARRTARRTRSRTPGRGGAGGATGTCAHSSSHLLQRLEDQVARLQAAPRPRLDPGNRPHREQRVAAEVEEVVADADPLHPQQRLPDFGEERLHRRARRDERIGIRSLDQIRIGQGRPVELAVGRERKAFHDDERRRHHVLGELSAEKFLQPPRVRVPTVARGQVRDEPGVLRRALPQDDHRGRHVGCAASAASISPGSTRNPRSLT